MKKILIIEDDQIVANIYRNKFCLAGFQVEVALDGQAGLQMVRTFLPDAVILDLMLPKMPGVELMKHIRAEPNFAHVPIIVFSNTYMTDMVQQAWKAGATKCLSKANCTPKQVIEVVRGTLSLNGDAAPSAGAPVAPASTVTVRAASPPASLRPVERPETPAVSDEDSAFQADLRRTFIEGLPATLSALRG